MTTSLVADRRFVVIIVASLVCKTSVGQQSTAGLPGTVTTTSRSRGQGRPGQLPPAMTLALSIGTVIYVAIALGVFGTLPVQEVIASGGTALAVAAQPTVGNASCLLMSITALFSTAGATNAGLYPAIELCDQLAANGTFPPLLGRRIGSGCPSASWSPPR